MKLQIGVDGKNYEVEVEVIEDDEMPRLPNFGPYQPFQTSVPTAPAQAKPAAAAAEPDVAEDKVCRSPVAGIVIKVNVKPGQQIKANDFLMVLEAMKMETNITAPIAGKLKDIKVKQGDSVQSGQVVAEFV